MAQVTSKIAGLERLRTRIGSVPETARGAVGTGLRDLAEATAAEMRQALAAQTAASAPGTAPSDRDGRIAEAITVETDPGGTGARVTIALPYAEALEFGTRTMAARPFLRPAVARAGQDASRLLVSRLDTSLKQDTP